MSLFNLLGPRFFSILTSQNRELYAEALFVLMDSFSPEEPTLRRDNFARKLAERFSELLQNTDFSDDEEYIAPVHLLEHIQRLFKIIHSSNQSQTFQRSLRSNPNNYNESFTCLRWDYSRLLILS